MDTGTTDGLIAQITGRDGMHVVAEKTIKTVIEQLQTATVDCLICDTTSPDVDGVTLLEITRALDPVLPVFVRVKGQNAAVVDRVSAARPTDIVTPEDEIETVASLIEAVARRYRTRSAPVPTRGGILDGAPDPIFVCQEGDVTYANCRATVKFGPAETDEGTDVRSSVEFDPGVSDLETWTRRITTGECVFDSGTASITTADGQQWVVDYVATAINWQNAPAAVIVLTGCERTQPKATASRQSESDNGVLDDGAYRQLFRDAINGIAIQRVITEEDGRAVDYVFEDVNTAFERITGLKAEEIQGKRGSDVFDLPEDPTEDPFITRYGDVALNGKRVDFEAYSEPLDQHHRVTSYPLDGKRIAAVFIDITDRVEATAELATYEEIVQRVEDPIMLQDRDGAFQIVNDAVVEYAGLPRSELLGADEFAFMDDETAERIQQMKTRVLKREDAIDYTISPTLRGGGERAFVTTRYPHYDGTGTIVGTVAISRDITQRKNRERQLQVLSRVLRHNLRNDLNVITGNAEVLREQTQGTLSDAADRILTTGTEVIDLINTERHIVELLTGNTERTIMSLTPLLSAAIQTVQASSPEAEIDVHCSIDVKIKAVPILEDAFTELIENGIDHNDSDTPRVTVEVSRDGNAVRIDIRDNGPGIPPKEQAVLTDQVEQSPVVHGTGLGLWLARYSISHAGGSLRFADAARGTHVVVTLPIVGE
ncbi:hybrid sensor histidine kinase/response regulator [Halorhabdus amylolytica]|uniref:hybrid sensor histidine kinase/response regulator n=1 Tax=Halorhabdus amylolytica TaxID=2559573 RepID=UPI00145ABE69|nr:PAS domain S-box protein [Halorhabdus amylolytica]